MSDQFQQVKLRLLSLLYILLVLIVPLQKLDNSKPILGAELFGLWKEGDELAEMPKLPIIRCFFRVAERFKRFLGEYYENTCEIRVV